MRTIAIAAALLSATSHAQTVDICDRTPQVRDEILKLARTDYCSAVDAGILAGVEILALYCRNCLRRGGGGPDNPLTKLRTGDFDGLDSLVFLYLDRNQLTTLPTGVFDGLSGLRVLLLNDNQLTTLPEGIFNGTRR